MNQMFQKEKHKKSPGVETTTSINISSKDFHPEVEIHFVLSGRVSVGELAYDGDNSAIVELWKQSVGRALVDALETGVSNSPFLVLEDKIFDKEGIPSSLLRTVDVNIGVGTYNRMVYITNVPDDISNSDVHNILANYLLVNKISDIVHGETVNFSSINE